MAWIFLLPSACLAQADSLVDFFPLAVGNQWIYHYERWVPTGEFSSQTDTGIASYSILGKADLPDSILWNFRERRNIHRSSGALGVAPADSTISDSTDFNLVEMKSERHELYRRLSDVGGWSDYNSSILWNSLLPFHAEVPDSSKVLRYHSPDSSGTLSFIIIYAQESMIYRVTLSKNSGLQNLHVNTTEILEEGVPWAHYSLLHQTIAAVLEPGQATTPMAMRLEQNYPNPFNPATTINYELPVTSYVTLKVFNLLGQELATLVNDKREPGTYAVTFDGSKLSSGMYFYRIVAGEYSATRKMVLLK